MAFKETPLGRTLLLAAAGLLLAAIYALFYNILSTHPEWLGQHPRDEEDVFVRAFFDTIMFVLGAAMFVFILRDVVYWIRHGKWPDRGEDVI